MAYVSTTDNRHSNGDIKSWDDLYDEDADLTLEILDTANAFDYTQVPVHYLRDSYYSFPKQIHLSKAETPCP